MSKTRRQFLTAASSTAVALASGACTGGGTGGSWPSRAGPINGRRRAGQRPDLSRPEGTDLIPQIEHIVVVMQENHSYDCVGQSVPASACTTDRDGQTVVVEGTLDAMAIAVAAIQADFPPKFCPVTQSGRDLSSRSNKYCGCTRLRQSSASMVILLAWIPTSDSRSPPPKEAEKPS
jgi:DMSO/TMAO reductase YedYZ molybdopterin-dependent catalytic subunit